MSESDSAESRAINDRDLRKALGSFVTGITIVTTVDDQDRPVGVTVSSFSSLSLSPPMVLWCIAADARSADTFANGARFAAHVLAHDQWPLAERFATRGSDKFDRINWRWSADRVPLIDGCAAVFECEREAVHAGGDHLIVTGLIRQFAVNHVDPLAYHRGRYALTHRGEDAAHLMSLQSW